MRLRQAKKIILMILVAISFIIVSPIVAASAEESSPGSEMIPDLNKLYEFNDNNKYFTEYKDNYSLDMEKTGIFDGLIGKGFNALANGIFALQVLFVKVLNILIFYTFELSIFDIFKDAINTITGNLQESIFNQFMYLAIALSCLMYIVKLVKSQRTQVWTGILKTVIVAGLAFAFFRNPVVILDSTDKISKSISQVTLDGVFKATNDGHASSSATEAMATNLWVMFVHKPWECYEFGNVTYAESKEDDILTKEPESDERQKVVDDIAKDGVYFKSKMGFSRLPLSIVYFIVFLVLAVVVGGLCVLTIGYQFLMMLFALFAPIVFVIALIPSFGFNTLKNWSTKVLGYASMKIVMSLILAIVFSFMLSCYQLTGTYGLLVVALIQATILIIVWIKREEIVKGLLKVTAAARQPSVVGMGRFRQDVSIESNIQNAMLRRKNKKEDPYNNSGNSGSNDDSKKVKNKFNKDYSSYKNATNRALGNDDKLNSNLIALRRIAEEILEDRYKNSKADSEKKAEAAGKEKDEIEYTPWVTQVMGREKMGLPKFEEREKEALINQIKTIQKNGGNVDELVSGDGFDNKDKVVRPKAIEPQKQKLNIVDRNKTDEEASSEYIKKFNDIFGTKYDTKFMHKLITNYGQKDVGNVISNMKKINDKKKIQNPAGYILTSLRQNKENGITTNAPGAWDRIDNFNNNSDVSDETDNKLESPRIELTKTNVDNKLLDEEKKDKSKVEFKPINITKSKSDVQKTNGKKLQKIHNERIVGEKISAKAETQVEFRVKNDKH